MGHQDSRSAAHHPDRYSLDGHRSFRCSHRQIHHRSHLGVQRSPGKVPRDCLVRSIAPRLCMHLCLGSLRPRCNTNAYALAVSIDTIHWLRCRPDRHSCYPTCRKTQGAEVVGPGKASNVRWQGKSDTQLCIAPFLPYRLDLRNKFPGPLACTAAHCSVHRNKRWQEQ